jgi:gamma-glutamyl-gamma-aminobutyrate hydrolase PuuD
MTNPPPLKIGISARIFHPQPNSVGIYTKTLQYLEESVAHWVMSRDVLVLMIPSVDKDGIIHRSNIRLSDYAKHLDGLVLQGGADVAPETYGEAPLNPEWAGDRVRDVYEMELLHEFVEAGKPVLGICRGAQVINVAHGGTLYQDIKTLKPDSFEHRSERHYDANTHDIVIVPDTALARLYPGQLAARVNSIHHQAVKDLGRDLLVEARSAPDQMIEAIRWTGKGYVFGVQWHPEFLNPADQTVLSPVPILDDFLAAVRKRM